MTQPTPLLTSRYEILSEIATGGMATVYRAFDRVAQRTIAFKRLSLDREQDPRIVALFQREYDTLARLRHPNIVDVYEFGTDHLGAYYTMELLTGESIRQLAPLPFEEACRILRDVASALALLHARSLLHRDVSFRNVLRLTDGRTKLIDFGALAPFGVATEIVGTPTFTAPECLKGVALDQRADLYALGALAYFLLTGSRHVGARTFDALPRDWRDSLIPPSQKAVTIPASLDALVLSLLSVDREQRPRSAAEVIDRLTTIASLSPEDDGGRVARSYLQHGPLQGRQDSQTALSEEAAQARAGSGRFAIVEGEQGLGRTSLLDHVAIEAQLNGATVLRVQGGMHTAPFSAARRLTQIGLGIFPAATQASQTRGSSLHSLLTHSDEKAPAGRSSVDASERYAATAGVISDALLALSERAPLVLLIDDAHAVDAESLGVLASIADAVESRSMLVVLSALSGQTAKHREAFERLRTRARVCSLEPLEHQDVARLVETVFGTVSNAQLVSAWLMRQTGGNPGHCIDLLHQLLEDGAIRYTVGTFTLPLDLDEQRPIERHATVVARSLVSFSPHALQVATLLSAHGAALNFEQLIRASGLLAQNVLTAVEELVERDAVTYDGYDVACRSEAIRSALLEQQGAEQMRAAHLALAGAFDAEGAATLDAQVAAARHRLKCGEAEALRGARDLAQVAAKHKLELGASRLHLVVLEEALGVLTRAGMADQECLGLLVPLSLSGFSGDLELQRKYAVRTLDTLAKVCGTERATRWARYIGKRSAVLLCVTFAALAFVLRRRKINRDSFVSHVQDLCVVPSAAGAALAAVYDSAGSEALARYLEPFSAFTGRTAPALLRDLCLATADIAHGRIAAARTRFESVIIRLSVPVSGLDASVQNQLRCGAMLGAAQALVTDASPSALKLADDLDRGSAFFGAHAEGVRAAFFAYRGEIEKAETHKRRTQSLAFQTGLWPVLTMMEVRWALAGVITGDVVRLVRSVADLQRLAHLSVGFEAVYELAQAHLDQLRGDPARALVTYQRVLATDVARQMPTYATERALHAKALAATGDHAGARQLCHDLMREIQLTGHDSLLSSMMCQIQLALAEADCGNIQKSLEVLEGSLDKIGRHENPLWLGKWHQARAYVAALAGDRKSFSVHFSITEKLFRSTENPCVIQLSSELRHFAKDFGIVDNGGFSTQRIGQRNKAERHNR